MKDIFDLRREAQARGGANYGDNIETVPVDLVAATVLQYAENPEVSGPVCMGCANVMTIVDTGRFCRQCRLQYSHFGAKE